jgi:hypothetical protein
VEAWFLDSALRRPSLATLAPENALSMKENPTDLPKTATDGFAAIQ